MVLLSTHNICFVENYFLITIGPVKHFIRGKTVIIYLPISLNICFGQEIDK